jgi:hypothetical protein
MQVGEKRRIGLAALVASIGVVALFGAAPASANLNACTHPPNPAGSQFTALSERGMPHVPCDHARDRALQVFHHGHTDGFHCTVSISGRYTTYKCVTPDDLKAFHTTWYTF